MITEAAVQTQVLYSSGSFTFWIMGPFQNLKTAWTMLPPKEKKKKKTQIHKANTDCQVIPTGPESTHTAYEKSQGVREPGGNSTLT